MAVLPIAVNASTLSAPHVTASAGSSITVPVNASGFSTVGAITMFLTYEASTLTYQSAQGMALSGMSVNSFVVGDVGTVALSWSAANGSTLADGTLIELVFLYSGGSTPLAFDAANCEVATLVGNSIDIVDLTLDDGSVQPAGTTGMDMDRSTGRFVVALGHGTLTLQSPSDEVVYLHMLDPSGRTMAEFSAMGRGTHQWPFEYQGILPLYQLIHKGQVRAGKPNLMVTP